MHEINKLDLYQLINSDEFSFVKQLVGEELVKLELRLNDPNISEHNQTRVLGELNALNRVLRLPELRLDKVTKQEKNKD